MKFKISKSDVALVLYSVVLATIVLSPLEGWIHWVLSILLLISYWLIDAIFLEKK